MTRISYCTAGFSDRGIDAALDAIAEAGFQYTELLGQEPHIATPPTGRPLIEFKSRLDERGLRVPTIHAPLRRNVLGAPDEVWRREKVIVLADYIRFAGRLGAEGIVIHPVPNPIFVPDADHPAVPGRIRDATQWSLDDLVPVAEEAGVRIVLENLPYHCDYPFRTVGELRPLVDRYPEEGVGLIIDTGHAAVVGDRPEDEIRIAGHRLWGTNLQDVARDAPEDSHWLPTHGGLNWDAIRHALDEVNYAGAWTFEVMSPRHGETLEELAQAARQVAATWNLLP